MECTQMFSIKIFVVVLLVVPLQSATVKPAMCPTNKIAPHRRIASYDRNRARTFGGAFIDLLTNDRPVNTPNQNDLQEKPDDDPDDCGEIEDYDETDLSSITPQTNRQPNQRRQERQDNRLFFGWFNRPQQQPFWPSTSSSTTTTRRRPQSSTYQTQRPTSATTVPPYWSGGLFQNNPYRPPLPAYPSNFVKPVHEHAVSEPQTTYWPGLVGGPLGNIVGASPQRPTFTPYTSPEAFTRPTRYAQSTTRPRLRIPYRNTDNLVGSFFDLLF